MTVFKLVKSNINGLYAVYENGVKVKNAIFKDKDDFINELKALNFDSPYEIRYGDDEQFYESGSASFNATLHGGIITITHGEDNSVLLRWTGSGIDWDDLFTLMRSMKERSHHDND